MHEGRLPFRVRAIHLHRDQNQKRKHKQEETSSQAKPHEKQVAQRIKAQGTRNETRTKSEGTAPPPLWLFPLSQLKRAVLTCDEKNGSKSAPCSVYSAAAPHYLKRQETNALSMYSMCWRHRKTEKYLRPLETLPTNPPERPCLIYTVNNGGKGILPSSARRLNARGSTREKRQQ